jgi:uncharacterized membrane protein
LGYTLRSQAPLEVPMKSSALLLWFVVIPACLLVLPVGAKLGGTLLVWWFGLSLVGGLVWMVKPKAAPREPEGPPSAT